MQINVIGAGILGASIAYELTLKGHSVTIADSWAKGGATSASAGIICPWVSKRRNMAWYALAKGGAAYYPKLINQLFKDGETNTGYKKVGTIRLHHNLEKLKELEKIALQRQQESPELGEVKLLNPKETASIFPYVKGDFHSLSISGAARVDGNALRNAMLNACKKHGASFIQGKASLIVAGNDVTGMEIQGKNHPADMTIAANGVWMNDLLKSLEPTVLFQTQKGELLHLQSSLFSSGTSLPVIKPPNNQYILPLNNEEFIAGATHQTARHSLNPSLTAEGMHYILDQLFEMTSGLEKTEIIGSRVGFRPFTKNHLPVFGPLPNFEGLIIANGLGASGLSTAPFIGKQLAKKISGETTDVPFSDYDVRLAE